LDLTIGDPMKLIHLVIAILLWVLVIHGQIIVDHNAVIEFDDIPDFWLKKAKALRVHYGHTSHGSQILGGLYWLEENIDAQHYKVVVGARNSTRTPDLPPQTTPPSLRIWEEGLWPYTEDQRLGYWEGELAQQGTIEVLNSDSFDVSGWSWCGQVALNDYEYIREYLDVMVYYQELFPDITFFYMTGHNVTPGTQPWEISIYENLQANNDSIRAHCLRNKYVLFDFADIECHDPEGTYYPDEDGECVWCEEWCANHPDDCINLLPASDSGCGAGCSSCAHTQGLQCNIKAKAFWWMMARLAGWDPDSAGTPISINSVPITADVTQNNISLQWEIFAEMNSTGFEIQRRTSIDKDGYEKIGFITSSSGDNRGNRYRFVDRNLLGGDSFQYRLIQVDPNGERHIINEISVSLKIFGFYTFQNYPNPFNNRTKIKFALPDYSQIDIVLFDIQGRQVKTLNLGQYPRGFHEVELDAESLASGHYIYELRTNDNIARRKMIVLK